MRAICLFAVALVIAAARPAAAEDKEKAKQFFEQAQAAEAQERYTEAAELYLEAFDHFEEPEFYFNAGEAYRLAKDAENAVKYFEEYLKLDPSGRGAADARKAIETLRPQVETQKPPADPDPPPTDPKPDPVAPPPIDVAAPPSSPTDPGRNLRLAGIATAAGGGLMLVVGIISGVQAKGISDDLSEVQQWLPVHDAKFEEGENAETRMFVFTSIGVAAAVTGGILYVAGVQRSNATEQSVTVGPNVAADRAGIVVQGRF